MPIINSPSAFILLLAGETRVQIKKGSQAVEAEIAAHPYIKAMCEIVEEVAEKATEIVEEAVSEVEEVIAPPEPAKAPEAPAPTADPAPESFNSLAVKASGLGIKVDGRWGIERLKAEIAVKEALATEDPEDDKAAEAALEAAKDNDGETVQSDAATVEPAPEATSPTSEGVQEQAPAQTEQATT